MLKTVLADLSKSFTKADMKTVVVHPSDTNRLRVSCCTDDKQYYVFGESIADGWIEKEFAFRDWVSISSIISSFYNPSEPDKCVMTLERNDEDYPTTLKVKSGRMKMIHYLQNYTFISRQDDLLNTYKGKKFQLKDFDENYFTDFDADTMARISKLSSLTGEKHFKVGLEDRDLYFYFGDANKTIDNAKICVCEDYQLEFKDKGLFFSVDYLATAINSLKDQNMKIRYDGGVITICGENEVSKKVMAVVGKKEI